VELSGLGRALLAIGLTVAVLGALLMLGGGAWLGRLPGDLSFKRGNVHVYAPLGTSLLISVVLTLVLNLVAHRR
jgi:hypothetical protein